MTFNLLETQSSLGLEILWKIRYNFLLYYTAYISEASWGKQMRKEA